MKKKGVVLFLALVLVVGGVVGGTFAWLTAKTDSVVNTFTIGDVSITLKESPLKADGTYGDPAEGTENTYQLIPGTEYKKDPVVAVEADSEDCYLFVKFEEIGNASTYITYISTLTAANGWTQGESAYGVPNNVYVRKVEKSDTTREWHLLKDDKIVINADAVTKDTMATASNAELKFTAYAVQYDNVDSAWDAWALISGS